MTGEGMTSPTLGVGWFSHTRQAATLWLAIPLVRGRRGRPRGFPQLRSPRKPPRCRLGGPSWAGPTTCSLSPWKVRRWRWCLLVGKQRFFFWVGLGLAREIQEVYIDTANGSDLANREFLEGGDDFNIDFSWRKKGQSFATDAFVRKTLAWQQPGAKFIEKCEGDLWIRHFGSFWTQDQYF